MTAPRWMVRLYVFFLRLYPPSFRQTYGPELEATFRSRMAEAARMGRRAAWHVLAQELYDLPRMAFRRRMAWLRSDPSAFERVESSVAVFPFLFFGLLIVLENSPVAGSFLWLAGLGLALQVLVILFALAGRIGRPLLPFLGLAGSIFSLNLFNSLIESVYGSPWRLLSPNAAWALRAVLNPALLWAGLAIWAILIVVVAALLPPLHGIFRRLRQDPTLLSFLLYGAGIFSLLVAFDEYTGSELFSLLNCLFLAWGALLYLKGKNIFRRTLALLLGLLVSTLISTAAIAYLMPRQAWFQSTQFTPLTEALSALFLGAWLIVVVLLPVAVGALLPPAGSGRAAAR